MSILIKGMEMPKSCLACPLRLKPSRWALDRMQGEEDSDG